MKALLILGNTQTNPDLYWILRVDVPTDLIYLRLDSREMVLVPQLEYSRLKPILGDRLISKAQLEAKDDLQAIQELARRYSISEFLIPPNTSFQLASKLQQLGFKLQIQDLSQQRRSKSTQEIIRIRKAAQIAAQGIMLVAKLARPGRSVEQIRNQLLKFLLEKGCDPQQQLPIIAPGQQSGHPHEPGHGQIGMDQPLMVDIFPRYRRYHADLTRTLAIGAIDPRIKEMHSAALEALSSAERLLKPSQECSQIYFQLCDVIESHGYSTLRKEPHALKGFIHSGGHGIGLELHELPSIAQNQQKLMKGDTLTLEPGIYDPELGGVRIEEDYLITSAGAKLLVKLPRELSS